MMSIDGIGALVDLKNTHFHSKTIYNIPSLNPKDCFDNNLLDRVKLFPCVLFEIISNTNRVVDIGVSVSQFLSDFQSIFLGQPMCYPMSGPSYCEIAFEHVTLMVFNDGVTRLEHVNLMTQVTLYFEWLCMHTTYGPLTKEEVQQYAVELIDMLRGLPNAMRVWIKE